VATKNQPLCYIPSRLVRDDDDEKRTPPLMRVQIWMPALSVPTTKADFAADRSERRSFVQERLTSDKFYMRFCRVDNVHLVQRRKKRE